MDYELVSNVGMVFLGVGTIWLLVLIFQESVAQGVITLWLLPLIYVHVRKDWKASRIPFAIHLLGIATLVYGQLADPVYDRKTNTLRSADRSASIVLPASWSRLKELDKEAILQAGDPISQKFLVIFRHNKSDTPNANVRNLLTHFAAGVTAKLKSPKVGKSSKRVINGMNVYQIEIHGVLERFQLGYLYSVIVFQDSYISALSWSTQESYPALKKEVDQILGSFKRIDTKTSDTKKKI